MAPDRRRRSARRRTTGARRRRRRRRALPCQPRRPDLDAADARPGPAADERDHRGSIGPSHRLVLARAAPRWRDVEPRPRPWLRRSRVPGARSRPGAVALGGRPRARGPRRDRRRSTRPGGCPDRPCGRLGREPGATPGALRLRHRALVLRHVPIARGAARAGAPAHGIRASSPGRGSATPNSTLPTSTPSGTTGGRHHGRRMAGATSSPTTTAFDRTSPSVSSTPARSSPT